MHSYNRYKDNSRQDERHFIKKMLPSKIFAGGKTIAFVDYGDIPEKDIYTTPSVIVKSRGIVEVEYYDKPFSHKSEMWSYASKTSELDTKFLYYY